jgi:hypothetical protein
MMPSDTTTFIITIFTITNTVYLWIMKRMSNDIAELRRIIAEMQKKGATA